MRYLFVHQSFPGQYLHLVQHLLKDPANEVVFISEPSARTIEGVRRLLYNCPTMSMGKTWITIPNSRWPPTDSRACGR